MGTQGSHLIEKVLLALKQLSGVLNAFILVIIEFYASDKDAVFTLFPFVHHETT